VKVALCCLNKSYWFVLRVEELSINLEQIFLYFDVASLVSTAIAVIGGRKDGNDILVVSSIKPHFKKLMASSN
jgi:hypothetical protein